MTPHKRALLGYRVKCTDGIYRFVHAQDAEDARPVYGDPDYDPRPVFRRQIERIKRQGVSPSSGRRRRSNKLSEPAQRLEVAPKPAEDKRPPSRKCQRISQIVKRAYELYATSRYSLRTLGKQLREEFGKAPVRSHFTLHADEHPLRRPF